MVQSTKRIAFILLTCTALIALAACSTTSSTDEKEETISGGISFSQLGGLYEKEFELSLNTDIKNAQIRYTMDGSDPTPASSVYSEKIMIKDRTSDENLLSAIVLSNTKKGSTDTFSPIGPVFKGTVIKAALFSKEGDICSDIAVQSYFVSQDIFTRYNMPIVSIVTDADNLFDSKTGIYTNPKKNGSDWERMVHFELYEKDGTAAVSQNIGVRLNGGNTRALEQKALRFYAKSDYDELKSTIEYEMFEGLTTSYNENIIKTYKRFIMRSSGNDNSGTLFRDGLMQELVNDLNVDTQAYRPCIAFINGEFWGIYNIRERYDKYYFASHYDISHENIAVLELSHDSPTPGVNEGDKDDLKLYDEMWDFFNENSMAEEINYQKAMEYIDIDNFIDYYIANIYSGNQDWPGNNNLFWRYKTQNGSYDPDAVWYKDGRFRWVLKDMDWGFGLKIPVSSDSLSFTMGEDISDSRDSIEGAKDDIKHTAAQQTSAGDGYNNPESTLLFRRLLENEHFKAEFINRFCDVMNTNYEKTYAAAQINAAADAIRAAIPEQSNRYPSSVSSIDTWESNVEEMIAFSNERPEYIRSFLGDRFALSAPVTVTLLNVEPTKGHIRINNTDITEQTKGVEDASNWSGIYFSGTSQTFQAIADDGYNFVKFIVTDNTSGAVTEYSDNTISITLESNGNIIQAVFN